MRKDRVNERLKLAHHRVVARALKTDPDLIAEARDVVAAWNADLSFRPSFVGAWERLLARPVDVVRTEIVRQTPEANRLRGSSPFALIPSRLLTKEQVIRFLHIAAGHATRILHPSEYPQYAEHLKKLDAKDRRRRFWQAHDDAWIDHFVAGIGEGEAVIGHYNAELELDGAIHIGLVERDGDRFAEMGVSVLPAARRRGIGHHLLKRAILWAQNHLASQFYSICMTTNRDMVHLARGHHMDICKVEDGTEGVIYIKPHSEDSVSVELIENQIGEWDYGAKAHQAAFSLAVGRSPRDQSRDLDLERLAKLATYGHTGVFVAYLIVFRYALVRMGLSAEDQTLSLAAVRESIMPSLEHNPHLRVYVGALPTFGEARHVRFGTLHYPHGPAHATV